jgi:hypothetical protein
MSKRIQDSLKDNDEKKVVLTVPDFNYLVSLDNIKQSFFQYMQQAETEFLKILSLRHGYLPEDDLEFNIRFDDKARELTIRKVDIPEEDKHLKKT